jgi:hypothetical protein
MLYPTELRALLSELPQAKLPLVVLPKPLVETLADAELVPNAMPIRQVHNGDFSILFYHSGINL